MVGDFLFEFGGVGKGPFQVLGLKRVPKWFGFALVEALGLGGGCGGGWRWGLGLVISDWL